MSLSRPRAGRDTARPEVSVNPIFTREPVRIARDQIPDDELDPAVA